MTAALTAQTWRGEATYTNGETLVEFGETSASSWPIVETVDFGAESAAMSGLLNGEA